MPEPPHQHRTATRRSALAAGLGLVAAACGTGSAPPGGGARSTRLPQLPRGGRTVFPRYRLVGYAGAPGAPELGRLGVGDVEEQIHELTELATQYADGRRVLPVLELIAVVAISVPGEDGMYRRRPDEEMLNEYVKIARRHRALLLIGVQPGRADFLDEARALERWLVEPEVGLALDPEWALGPDEVPEEATGHTTGSELNDVSVYLSRLVSRHRLPEKVMVYHQLKPGIVSDHDRLAPHHGVAPVVSVDGIGSPTAKTATWKRVMEEKPRHVHPGFKLFFEENGELMTPEQVLALKPQPEYVLYE